MRSVLPQCSHITRKRGIYHYRRRVPGHNGGEIVLSLSTRHYRSAEALVVALDRTFQKAWRYAVVEADAGRGELTSILRAEMRSFLDKDLQHRLDRRPGEPVYAHWWEPGNPGTAKSADREAIQQAIDSLTRDLADNNADDLIEGRATELMHLHALPEELRGVLRYGLIEAAIAGWKVKEQRTLGLVPMVFQGDHPAPDVPRAASIVPPRAPSPPASPPVVAVVLFESIVAGWAADNGHTTGPGEKIKRALYDRERTIERLAIFLGHRDAAQVAKADAVRWKENSQARGNKVPTIRNDISEMSAIWKWGVRNGKLLANPFEGLLPPKLKSKKKQRRAFTQEEAAIILTAARQQKGYTRWLPWVCCFTGGRLSEVCQSYKEDLVLIDGVPVLRIHDEGDEDSDDVRSIKNEDSRRNVPIHPALIAEGFLAYVAALPAGSPLFPDAKPDKMFGHRGTNAGKKVSRWMKETLEITDPKISPNHSWRHWFIEACRGVRMHPEVRSALTGHSAKADESSQYGAAMGSFVRVLADALATVPSPLDTPTGAPQDSPQAPSTVPA